MNESTLLLIAQSVSLLEKAANETQSLMLSTPSDSLAIELDGKLERITRALFELKSVV